MRWYVLGLKKYAAQYCYGVLLGQPLGGGFVLLPSWGVTIRRLILVLIDCTVYWFRMKFSFVILKSGQNQFVRSLHLRFSFN